MIYSQDLFLAQSSSCSVPLLDPTLPTRLHRTRNISDIWGVWKWRPPTSTQTTRCLLTGANATSSLSTQSSTVAASTPSSCPAHPKLSPSASPRRPKLAATRTPHVDTRYFEYVSGSIAQREPPPGFFVSASSGAISWKLVKLEEDALHERQACKLSLLFQLPFVIGITILVGHMDLPTW